MFDPRSGAGDTSIARLVAFANRLPGLTFALDVGSPTDLLEPTLAGLVVIPPIGPEIAAAIVPIVPLPNARYRPRWRHSP